ncbi:autophagy protein 13 [Coemansia sp. RSA 2611]|nr:autophagy protein 13 [Coemansia sp. RSA 2610]KAJ2390941.1 autophagy protein 13 [Coemansia sp. RSA 2611]
MTQRPFFWGRQSAQAETADDSARGTSRHARGQKAASEQTIHATRAAASQVQPRLPPNSGSARPQPSSFSSSHSSSPSPSINAYAGSLRAMLDRSAAMPVNIRRVEGASRSPPETAIHTRGSADGWHSARQQRAASMRLSAADNGHSLPTHSTTASAAAATANKDARCEQIVQNFYSKAAQVIAHLRGYSMGYGSSYRGESAEATSATLPPRITGASTAPVGGSSIMYASSTSSSAIDIGAGGRRINKWFNLNLEDIGGVKEDVKPWRHAVATLHVRRPPPLYIEVCLDVSGVRAGEELQLTDVFGRPWSVDLELSAPAAEPDARKPRRRRRRATAIVLEVWRLDLDVDAVASPAPDLPRLYKHAIVFFRSLYSFASLLPSVEMARQLAAGAAGGLSMFCTLRAELAPQSNTIDLDVGLTGTEKYLETHAFEPVATPLGTFAMSVQYRRECLFACSLPHSPQPQDCLAGYAADDTYFTPTLSSRSGSNFSLQRPRMAPMSATSPYSALAAAAPAPWHEATSPGADSGPHGAQRIHSTSLRPQLQGQALPGSSLTSDRSLTMPAVNPFRARPLSMGDSASLPSYLGSTVHARVGSRLSVEGVRPSDLLAADAGRVSTRTSLRRISLGARSYAADPALHQGDTRARSSTTAGGARPHSLEHRPARLNSSGAAPAADSGSILHRSVMLRRFGDSLSPTEPHRHLDAFGRGSDTTGSRSPPKRSIASIRSMSSGSAGSAVTGRSGLGIAPFKSPSLSESPNLGLGAFADAAAANDSARSLGRTPEEVSRRRGYTVGHEMPVPSVQRIPVMSDSPSSIATSGSGHSRRLSSSFGNRRASMRRHPSVLGTAPAERPTADGAGISRRHTIVEGQVWTAEKDQQDIDDFIRMVDAKQPLRAYAQREQPSGTPREQSNLPLSAGAVTAERPGNGSLQRYHGFLSEFDGISRDMENSVLLTKTPEDMELGSLAEGELASSPFRRVAMPNPLRNSGDQPPSMASTVAATTATSAATAPVRAEAVEENVDLLQQAFDGLSIESQESATLQSPRTHLPVVSPRRGHVRSAAPGLDMERERPLPRPVTIPRSQSGSGRRAKPKPRPPVDPESDPDEPEEERPRAAPVRGKSQPLTQAPGIGSDGQRRMATPQPLSYSRQPPPLPQPPASVRPIEFSQPARPLQPRPSRGASALRLSPDTGPFSYRSDFTAGSSQLNALLSIADDNVGVKAPRSTPSTPSQPASTLFTRTGGRERRATATQQYDGIQLRSNFPPLSFIVPRARVEQSVQPPKDAGSASEDDEDLMFQMESSMH